jgi:hypothetical protein
VSRYYQYTEDNENQLFVNADVLCCLHPATSSVLTTLYFTTEILLSDLVRIMQGAD